MQFYFVNSPFKWSCVQVCDVVDDFCFLMVSLCSKLVVGIIKFTKVGRHQDRMAEHVTVSNVPDVSHTSSLLQSMTWVVSTSEMFPPEESWTLSTSWLFGANRRFRTAASVQGVHFQRCAPDSVAQPLKSGGGKSLITTQTSKICCLDTDGLAQTTRDTTELIKSRARPSPDSPQEGRLAPSCCPHGTPVGFSQDSVADLWLPRQEMAARKH